MKSRSDAVQMKRGYGVSQEWPKVSKNERHGYDEPEVPAAAPPPAPARALQTISGKLEHAKRNHAHRPIVLSWEDAETIKTVLQVAAHLQAELDAIHNRRAETWATCV